MSTGKKYSIGELSGLAGVSRRTIRYYVQRGLVPPPPGAGRGHYYTGEHFQRLLSIKLLQDRGLSLDEIERHLAGTAGSGMPARAAEGPDPGSLASDTPRAPGPETPPADLSLWTRVSVAEGVELNVEGGRYRLPPGRLARLRRAVRAIIGDPFPQEYDTARGEEENG